jgi:hypothetical protein
MEDASAVDLDWFWRAWFFDIEPVDISLDSVVAFQVESPASVPVKLDTFNRGASRVEAVNPKVRGGQPVNLNGEYIHVSRLRNKAEGMRFAVDTDTSLRDKYYYEALKPVNEKAIEQRDKPMIVDRYRNLAVLDSSENLNFKDKFYYELHLSNKGGTVMPVIIQWNFTDGTSEVDYIHAYIWRKNEQQFTKTFAKNKEVSSIQIDPFKETADIDESNNHWPEKFELNRFEVYKSK